MKPNPPRAINKLYCKKAARISDIDGGILPLVNVLNKWKKHKDGHYSGIATTFSCDGDCLGEAYISFHSSKRCAEVISSVIQKFKAPIKWDVEFYTDSYRLHTIGKHKHNEIKKSILAIAIYLKTNLKLLKDDCGWRLYHNYCHLNSYKIRDTNIKYQFKEYLVDALEYIASCSCKTPKKRFIELMSNKYGIAEKDKIERAIKRLKEYGMISEQNRVLKINKRFVPVKVSYPAYFSWVSNIKGSGVAQD